MAHSDDNGLIIPPKLAPTEVVVVPIYKTDNKAEVLAYTRTLYDTLRSKYRTVLDDDDQNSPGWKFSQWEMMGVPIRIEIGPRDMANRNVVLVRRDTGEKISVAAEEAPERIEKMLADIQVSLYRKALEFRENNTTMIDDYESFKKLFSGEGGFVKSPWCGSPECEAKIKEETKATVRILAHMPAEASTDEPVDANEPVADGSCLVCSSKASHHPIFAKAY
jgi:prolyl-tRNA synthetase